MREYKGYKIIKTGKQSFDYRVLLGSRHRWGTMEELKHDIDRHINGVLIPYEPNK